ncbi:VPS35 endosomal protein sorting factor-like, partial [Trichonephila inaurata madagascariensis]
YQVETTCDPVIINAAMFICKTIHDSVNALTLDDEKRQIGVLICAFIRKISFGRDFEQQLGFYVEARATFSNLDAALIQLVQCVNLLAMRTRQIVKGHHTRKTSSFVKACIAYSFITIPSLMDVFSRLDLYLISGQVALLNQCLSQADAFLKSAISLIPDSPTIIEVDNKHKSTEPYLLSYINNLLSTLLIVPDHPEQEPLYLIRGLLNVIQGYSWVKVSDVKSLVYLNVLNLLSALSQESYIWSIDGVDSNDALYGSDPKFIGEINKICSTLLDEILAHMKFLGDRGTFQKQSCLALELLCHIVAHGDLSNDSLFNLAYNLWFLAHRHGHVDQKLAANCLSYIKVRAYKGGPYQELANKVQVPTQV